MSLIITKTRLLQILTEEIDEALTAGWETIYDDPEEPEERTGDLPAGEPLASPLPSKEEPDPYPIHPSPKAMAMAMDWYRIKSPKNYKSFIKDKGPQQELDRIKRTILRAAREIDAAESRPPSPAERRPGDPELAGAATVPMSQMGEGALLRQYIKEELNSYLDEVYSKKQKDFMCAMKDAPAGERPESLSQGEAEHLCKAPIEEPKKKGN